MFSRRHASLLLRTLILIAIASSTSPVHAVKYWRDAVTNGNWSTGSNWSSTAANGPASTVPVGSEPVRISSTIGPAHTVTLDVSPPTLGLIVIDHTLAGNTNTLSITNSFNLTSAAMFVGGHNGTAATNGRGALTQLAGAVAMTSGADLVLGHGAGSSGTYTLSGGSFTATQSEFIGYGGTGTVHHSGGTNTINEGAIGSLNIGNLSTATGIYNLSDSGQLNSHKSVYVGDQGIGIFNQTGGTHTISGDDDLYLGWASTGNGTYTISGTAALSVADDVTVGLNGTGTLNIQANANVHIGDTLNIGVFDAVNMSGGSLRFNNLDKNLFGTFNYTGGKIQLGGINRNIGTDPIVTALFGASPVIPSGKELAFEGSGDIDTSVNVNGGKLSTSGGLNWIGASAGSSAAVSVTNGGTVYLNGETEVRNGATVVVDGPGSSFANSSILYIGGVNTNGFMTVSGGGSVTAGSSAVGLGTQGSVSVTGPGSTWTTSNLRVENSGVMTIQDNARVSVGEFVYGLEISNGGTIYLNGGTLRSYGIDTSNGGNFAFNSGTIEFAGSRSIGADGTLAEQNILTYFGESPVIPAGKGLTIEATATLLRTVVIDGGTFSAAQIVNGSHLTMQRGTLNITNQAVTIGSGGLLGSTLDLDDDMTVNIDLGITNQGLVTGDGQIGGAFVNAATGELRASAGKSLKLTGANNTNAGRINLVGGELEFTQNLTNQSGGLVSGNGTLIARSGLTNQGIMNFAGTANILGDVTNSAGGRIISGGGGATVFFDDVVNNAEIRTSANGFSVFFGSVSGSGTFTGTGTVNFEGDLNPGNSPAAVSFGGDVSFGPDATLQIEIGGLTAGSQHDKLTVAGDLALDGALEVMLINSFNPIAGQTFNILDWLGTRSGTFSSLALPTLAGLTWDTSTLYADGIFRVASADLPGDFNHDGAVDAADYIVWRKGAGVASTPANYNLWRTNFGRTAGGGGSQSVPEPHAALLAVLAVAYFPALRTRKRLPRRSANVPYRDFQQQLQ